MTATFCQICVRLRAAAWSTFRAMLGCVNRRPGSKGCRLVVRMFESSDPLTKTLSDLSLFWGSYLSWWKVVGKDVNRQTRKAQTAEKWWTKIGREADANGFPWLINAAPDLLLLSLQNDLRFPMAISYFQRTRGTLKSPCVWTFAKALIIHTTADHFYIYLLALLTHHVLDCKHPNYCWWLKSQTTTWDGAINAYK